MSLAGDTVIFGSFTEGDTADSLGMTTEVAHETEITGCRFRPLSATETAQTEFDIASEVWKCTAPPVPAALAADVNGYLKFGGEVYQIIAGAQPFTDLDGSSFKVTVLARKQDS